MTDIRPAAPFAGGGLRPAFAASRSQWGLVVVLFALAGAAWWWTVHVMQGMDDGPWTGLGTFGWFLGVWVVMMAAMMFPSVAPTIALYARMAGGSRVMPWCSPAAISRPGLLPESLRSSSRWRRATRREASCRGNTRGARSRERCSSWRPAMS